jgi:cephalosporin-C deacetylase-like acetyl esterase
MASRVVHFFSDGFKIEADYQVPDNVRPGEKVPGLVLCAGFGSARNLIVPDYAKHFVEAGFATLGFDYRGFGGSEGDHTRIIANESVQDIRAALTWLSLQPEVDVDRLGLWGTSGGGAHTVTVTGLDKRVKAGVAQVGYCDGYKLVMEHKSPEDQARLLAELDADRKQRVLSGKSGTMRVIDLLANPDTRNFVLEEAKTNPSIIAYLTYESTEATLEYRPIDAVRHIGDRALMFIAAEKDDLCFPETNFKPAYDAATGPKKWLMYPIGHYEIYPPEWCKKSADEAIAWFREHL